MGKRGFKGKGYSIKYIQNKPYCYVWEEWDDITSKEERSKNNKNYSRSHGWKSLGNWWKLETQEKLKRWLSFKYGDDEMNEMLKKIEKDIEINKKE